MKKLTLPKKICWKRLQTPDYELPTPDLLPEFLIRLLNNGLNKLDPTF